MKIDNLHRAVPFTLLNSRDITSGRERSRPNMERPMRTKDLLAHVTDPESRLRINQPRMYTENTSLNLSSLDCFLRLLENSLPGPCVRSFLIPNSRLSCTIFVPHVSTYRLPYIPKIQRERTIFSLLVPRCREKNRG